MLSVLSVLSGYKTYAIAAATIAYALVHCFLIGDMTSQQCTELVVGGAGLGALRHGISTELANLIRTIGPAVLDSFRAEVAKDEKKADDSKQGGAS
jgi:hypothetical protein